MILGYIRVSTVDQAGDEKTSLQVQENVIMGYAQMNGLSKFDVQIYKDAGVSGSTRMKNRDGGSKLLEYVQAGDTVVASKMDRIFRSSIDALETIEFLKAKGAHLVLFDMGTQSVMRDGPSKLFFSMLAAFAEFERGRIVERITTGKYQKKKKGGHVGGVAPYGYKIVGRGPNAKLEIEPEEQRVVEMIRERIKASHDVFFSPAKTVKEFAELGIKTRTGKNFQNVQIRRIARDVRAQTC